MLQRDAGGSGVADSKKAENKMIRPCQNNRFYYRWYYCFFSSGAFGDAVVRTGLVQ